MTIHSTTDVFTPTRQAKLTFVERTDNELNANLVDALRTPGTQVIIYGHSGTGKSTLLFNVVHRIYERIITTRCTATMSYEQLILSAFDELDPFYQNQMTGQKNWSIDTRISGLHSEIKSSISSSRSVVETRMVPPQLTAQRLAQLMGAAKCCWVIEDFHKISGGEKVKLSQQLKVFVDTAEEYPDVKTILIGAVNSAREVVEYDREMSYRVAELHVPLMNESQLHEILEKGENLLNINFPQEIKNNIVRFSSGIAAVTHRIALNMCQDREIEETKQELFTFNGEDFTTAIRKYINQSSDTLRNRFELATRVGRVRKYENGRIILNALANFDLEEIQLNTLLLEIRKQFPTYPAANLTTYLKQLQEADKGQIIVVNTSNGKYTFSDPLIRTYVKCQKDIESDSNTDPKVRERKIKAAMEVLMSELIKQGLKHN